MEIIEKYNQLVDEYRSLQKAYHESLRPITITYKRFLSYLGNAFTIDTMPKSSGIYVYVNHSSHLIYVGQSKNMRRRLQQHFKRGSIAVEGHDSEFKDISDWSFHVLEYSSEDKEILNIKEAYWIAIAKMASLDKRSVDHKAARELKKKLLFGGDLNEISNLVKVKQSKATTTNRTLGNRRNS